MTAAERERILAPLRRTSWRWWTAVLALAAIVALGGYAYAIQVRDGLAVTGLGRPVYWGMYILNLIFFIGISYGGTLASGVLRLTGATWRHPITRTAEAVTVCALLVGGPQPLIDLGRLDRAAWILLHPQPSSPMLWDILAISTYLALSVAYFWLALIPDAAALRDAAEVGPARRRLYRALALGFSGGADGHRRLDRALGVMAVVVIPAAVAAHTVLSWVPGLSLQPTWHSPLMGPYFVLGAVFSGVAAIIVALAVLRRALGLREALRAEHFAKLGLLLLALSLIWSYFTFAEHLTYAYSRIPAELRVLRARAEHWGGLERAMIVGCGVAPLALFVPRLRTIPVTVAIALAVIAGMWLERFLILVPTAASPRLPYPTAGYAPTWVEWCELAGSAAAFALLLLLCAKLVPMVSLWESEPVSRPGSPGSSAPRAA